MNIFLTLARVNSIIQLRLKHGLMLSWPDLESLFNLICDFSRTWRQILGEMLGFRFHIHVYGWTIHHDRNRCPPENNKLKVLVRVNKTCGATGRSHVWFLPLYSVALGKIIRALTLTLTYFKCMNLWDIYGFGWNQIKLKMTWSEPTHKRRREERRTQLSLPLHNVKHPLHKNTWALLECELH